MKRWMWIMPLVVLLAGVAASSVCGNSHAPGTPGWSEVEQTVPEDPVGFSQFATQFEDFFATIKTTIGTYVSTVVTVVAAVVNALKTVVVAITKLALRFAFTIAKALVQWLISVVF